MICWGQKSKLINSLKVQVDTKYTENVSLQQYTDAELSWAASLFKLKVERFKSQKVSFACRRLAAPSSPPVSSVWWGWGPGSDAGFPRSLSTCKREPCISPAKLARAAPKTQKGIINAGRSSRNSFTCYPNWQHGKESPLCFSVESTVPALINLVHEDTSRVQAHGWVSPRPC